MRRSTKTNSFFVYVGIFILGLFLLFIRNPDPIFNPVIYAEDGTWTALGLREGWLHAFLFSRHDYFVFLNTFLLFLSSYITDLWGNGTIEALPYAIAFFSYSFFSAFSLLTFITIKKASNVFFATLGLLLTLLIPLGSTQNEIIGRILQIGFFMPPLALMLFFWRDRQPTILLKSTIDSVIFIAAATNPVVIALAFFYYINALVIEKKKPQALLRENIFLGLALLILTLALLPRIGGHGGIPGGFHLSRLIETSIARPILYPFFFTWYEKLSDPLTLIICIALYRFVARSVQVSKNKDAKYLILATLLTMLIYIALTIAMRPGLTGLLHSYQSTFPDRYFMGINALSILLVIVCLSQLIEEKKTRRLSKILTTCIVLIYISDYSSIFEWKKSKFPIHQGLTFYDQICLSKKDSKHTEIQIYPTFPPNVWRMIIPSEYVEDISCKPKKIEQPQHSN